MSSIPATATAPKTYRELRLLREAAAASSPSSGASPAPAPTPAPAAKAHLPMGSFRTALSEASARILQSHYGEQQAAMYEAFGGWRHYATSYTQGGDSNS